MKEKNCKTIRKVLSEYTWFLMGVTFLMLLVFWGFYMFSNYCYQKNTDHVLTLNSFYNDLDSSSLLSWKVLRWIQKKPIGCISL